MTPCCEDVGGQSLHGDRIGGVGIYLGDVVDDKFLALATSVELQQQRLADVTGHVEQQRHGVGGVKRYVERCRGRQRQVHDVHPKRERDGCRGIVGRARDADIEIAVGQNALHRHIGVGVRINDNLTSRYPVLVVGAALDRQRHRVGHRGLVIQVLGLDADIEVAVHLHGGRRVTNEIEGVCAHGTAPRDDNVGDGVNRIMVEHPSLPILQGGEAHQVQLLLNRIFPGTQTAHPVGGDCGGKRIAGAKLGLDETLHLGEVHAPFVPCGYLGAILGDGRTGVVLASPLIGKGRQQV